MNARTKRAWLITLGVAGAVLLLVVLPLVASHFGDTKDGLVDVPRNVESALEKENFTFSFVPSTDESFMAFDKEARKSPMYIYANSSAEFVRWFKAGNSTELSKAYIETKPGNSPLHYFVYWAPLMNGLGSVVYYEKIDFSPYPFFLATANLKKTPSATATGILVSYSQKANFRTLAFFWVLVPLAFVGLFVFTRYIKRRDDQLRAARLSTRSSAV